MTEKNRFLSVCMTEAERKHWDELAEKCGLSLSNTIRVCINGAELRERQSPEVKYHAQGAPRRMKTGARRDNETRRFPRRYLSVLFWNRHAK